MKYLVIAILATLMVGCTPSPPGTPTSVTVVTHDSFALPEETIAAFETQTGFKLQFVAPGDAGTVLNQLILTRDAPLGDAVFGIDTTFAGRALDAGILASYTSAKLPESAKPLLVGDQLTPIDFGDVCLNADDPWFAAHDLAIPETLDDLLKPEYRDLLVLPNPATSSPGLAFLIATIGAKGDPGYLDYWQGLKANGVKVVKGWTEAYTGEFSGSSGHGSRPLVLSYASSPAFEPATSTLLDTCFRQVEYAGVIAGAANPEGAKAFIDFMLSDQVQAQIPESMYMYPVADVPLPQQWQDKARVAPAPIEVDINQITAHREDWIKAWTATVLG